MAQHPIFNMDTAPCLFSLSYYIAMSETIIPELFHFIELHKNDNPDSLRFRFHDTVEKWMPLAINHIESLQKCGSKFGALQPEIMGAPLSVEQASSESVAMIHADIARHLVENPHMFLDMTCGLGIDFKAITNAMGQQCRSIAVELQDILSEAAAHNFRDMQNVSVINGDSVEWLKDNPYRFDLVFIDPARRNREGKRLYNIHDCMPDVGSILRLLREKADKVMVKLSPMLDVSRTLLDLPCSELHIVDEGGDCRELLAVMDFTSPEIASDKVPITIHSSAKDPFTFTRHEEQSAKASYGIPNPGDMLFEPSPATMKAAPFSLLSERCGLTKLHPNTHLYFSREINPTLPGKWHEIMEVLPFSSSMAKALAKKKLRADVAVRNFPLSAPELAGRMAIKSGGDTRIIGVTAAEGSRLLIMLRK